MTTNRALPYRATALAAFALAALLGVAPAAAQRADAPPLVSDLVLGTHVSRLPVPAFVDPACYDTLTPLGGFDRYLDCAPGDDGLREIAFSYDDLDQTIALARGSSNAARLDLMAIDGQPIRPSILVDADGRVMGYRIATVAGSADNPVDPVQAAAALKRGHEGWSCVSIPPAAGEGPLGDLFVHETCTLAEDGRSLVLETEWLVRTLPDGPQLTRDRASLLVVQTDSAAAPAIALGQDTPLPDTTPRPPYANRRQAFLAGASVDCRDCDLSGLDLRRRDLAGANLTNANLAGAILHRADLSGANLTNADLRGTNLNRANLSGATLRGVNAVGAMFYAASAEGADFTGAGLRSALFGTADLRQARFDGASLDNADLSGADLSGGSFFFATLRYTGLEQAILDDGDLRGLIATDAILTGASLATADLSDAVLSRAELTGANLAGANLTNVDLRDAVLLQAILDEAVTTGARFTGATMPDGSIAP